MSADAGSGYSEGPACALPAWSESDRLAALERYAILDTGRDEAFDDVAELAADILGAPMAVVNFLASDRQWFKAEVGIGVDTLPLDVSICRHALLQSGVMVVPDLTQDPRFEHNPLVDVAEGLRFYADALLQTPEGLPLGTVCVLDREARPMGITQRQTRALKALAAQTMAQLELRRSEAIAQRERARAEKHSRRVALLAEASARLLAASDIATMIREVYALLAEDFELDVCFHYACHAGGLGLVASAGLTPEQEVRAARIEFGETICGIVAQTRQGVHLTGVQQSDDPHAAFLKMLGIDTYSSAPMVAHDELLGTLSFGRKSGAFSPGELEVLRTLTAHVATVIERLRADERLRASRTELELLTDTLPALISYIGADRRYRFANRTYDSWFTTGRNGFLGKTLDEALGEGAYAILKPKVDAVLAGERVAFEAFMPYENGPARHIHVEYVPRVAADSTVEGFYALVHDVSEAKKAETALRISEAKYRSLFEALDVGFCIIEMKFDDAGRAIDYRITEANPAFERQTGLVDAAGKWVSETAPHLERHWFDTYGRVASSGETIRFENEAAPFGRWYDVHAFPTGARGDHRVAILFNDITQRRRAEQTLRELNETLEGRVEAALAERKILAEIVEGTDAFVQVVGKDFRWLAINNASVDHYRRIYGVAPRVGDSMLDLFAAMPEHQAEVKAPWARALAGEEFTQIAEFGDPDRDRRAYEMKHNVLRGANGDVIGAYQFVYDVTDRLRHQTELAQAQAQMHEMQKLETIGQLTGGVAHDFNNLLTPIVGALDVLSRRLNGDERAQRLTTGALQAAERARTLIQRLLAFARRQHLQARPVDICALVDGMTDMVARSLGPQIRLSVDSPTDLPPAQVDPNQLELALLNLAVNARDAMPGGGELAIAVARESIADDAKLNDGDFIRITVSDTGVGMDADTLRRSVEPFFTTKGVGRGTGLGLSSVHGLAAQSDGLFLLTSEPGVGTTATLWLPVSAEASGGPSTAAAGQDALPRTRTATVLLVDDEELVRSGTADMLTDMGYTVVEASSGHQALQNIKSGLSFDVLVTDYAMPGMTGADLARELAKVHPDRPVLLITGYASLSDGQAGGLARLAKPFRQADLAAAVADALDEGNIVRLPTRARPRAVE